MTETALTKELTTVLVSTTIILIVIEYYYKKGKLKNDWLFNWTFPGDKPFSLFVLPLITLFAINSLLLGNMNFLLTATIVAIATQVLVEEIVFRGMVFGALLKHFHESKKIVLWKFTLLLFAQAMIFALVHYQTKNFLGVFLSGTIFGLAFYLSEKNVIAPTIIHLSLNLLLFQNYFVSKIG